MVLHGLSPDRFYLFDGWQIDGGTHGGFQALSKITQDQPSLYLIDAQPGIDPLLIGTGHSKRVGTVTNQFGVHELDQIMSAPIAWTWKNSYGNRVFTTSLGHTKDFTNQNALRVIVNVVFWSAGRPIPSAEIVLNTFSMSAK